MVTTFHYQQLTMKLLIIGSTGKIGTEMVYQLLAKGIHPIIASRSIKKAQKKFGINEHYVAFDFEKPQTFPVALKGIDKVFFIAPHNNPSKSVQLFLEEAKAAHIQHITFSSGRTTGDIPGKPLFKVTELVRASGIPYTIIVPAWFMQNFCNWLGGSIVSEDKIIIPAADAKMAFIDVRDIAAVAIKTLTEEGHAGKTYELTSDEALDHYEVAEKISQVRGKPVQYIPLSNEDYVTEMLKRGGSEAAANYVNMLFDIVKTGKEASVSEDLEQVLHRLPISFDEFVEDYVKVWKN